MSWGRPQYRWHRHSMRYIRPMLRGCSCVIAVTAIVAGLPMMAQAAEPATLTLTCKGTATIRADYPLQSKPQPLSMTNYANSLRA